MSMDGTNLTILVKGNVLHHPNGLSLDYGTETLFWIDAGTDEIGRIGIDGTRRRIVADLRQFFRLHHPFSLEFYKDKLYYSDWKTDSIQRLTSSFNMELTTVMCFDVDPTSIHVVHMDRQPGLGRGSKFSYVNDTTGDEYELVARTTCNY